MKEKIFTIPNVLSFVRIGLIPFIAIFYFNEKTYLTVLLIVLSALTDIVDGFIARKFNMISALGKALDPIADKLTLLTLLTCLCLKHLSIIFLLLLFVVKELIVGIEGVFILKLTKATYSAKWYGKATTVVLYLTILILILFDSLSENLIPFLIFISSSFIILSLVLYSIMNVKRIFIILKKNNT